MAVTFQIIGHKKSGKTLITTRLINKLKQSGYRVAAIKHSAHPASMDVKGTDSYRFTAAGAHQVFLESNGQLFYHQSEHSVDINHLVDFLDDTNDFILIEGHKDLKYSKICLLKENESLADISSSNVVISASLGDNNNAKLKGCESIVNWCFKYLKDKKEGLIN